MKQLAILSLSAFLFCTGCSTFQTGTIVTPSRVKAVSYLGTTLALQQHPEWRLGFQLAATELKVIESQEQIDFTTVLAIIHKLPVKQLQGNNAILYITASTLLLDDLGGSLDMGKVEKVRPYVTGLREGIELALQPVSP